MLMLHQNLNLRLNHKLMNVKEIEICELIKIRIAETEIDAKRICSYLDISENELDNLLVSNNVSTQHLLKFSKILKYDFFRIYSQHLILYSPSSAVEKDITTKSSLPQFRKSIYTQEIIDFVLSQISSGNLTKTEIIERYNIPKTTLYKWISKYQVTK